MLRNKSICRMLVLLIFAAASAPEAAGVEKSERIDGERTAVSVDGDSLASLIRLMSIDPATSEPRSRYAFREGDIGAVADTLVSLLERYTGSAVSRQSFEVSDFHDSTFTIENIICTVPATGPSSGDFLVTAHFDATAHRVQDNWDQDWKHLEAPGADDNATGVAAVLEAARVLSQLDLPFDMKYVLFTAEELGRIGSMHYVSLCDEDCAGRHLGLLNADMLGYSGTGTGAAIMSDFRSGWLAEMVIEYASESDPDLETMLIMPGPSNWDHASFWDRSEGRLPAITLAEPLGPTGSILYPDYHTTGDLPDNVDIEQTRRIASIMTGFISSFEGEPPEISLLEPDLLVLVNGAIRHENVFRYGEEISILPRIRNTGGSDPPEGAVIRLDVWIENAAGVRKVYSGVLPPAGPLRSSDAEIHLGRGDGLGGQNIVRAEVTVSGMQDDPDDNSASASFIVTGTGAGLENHHFSPNPVSVPFSEAMFCVNISEAIDLMLEIHSLEGDIIGSAKLGAGYGYPISEGLSCHDCGDILPGIDELVPGIYLYRIIIFRDGAEVGTRLGRFAVER